MENYLWLLFVVTKWYLYIYVCYYCLMILLSLLCIRLGFSHLVAHYISQIFQVFSCELQMANYMWLLFVVTKWYLYLYVSYYCLMILLSSLCIRLGFSHFVAHSISRIFQFIEKCRRKFDKLQDSYEVDDVEHVECENLDENSDIYNTLYSKALQNGCKDNSSTIKKHFALQPDIQSDLKSHIENDTETVTFSNAEKNVFELADIMVNVKAGVEAIIEDQVMSKFEAEKLISWNLLTRNNPQLRFYNWKIVLLWFLGLLVRYFIVLPIRILNCIVGLTILFISMSALSYIPDAPYKKTIYKRTTFACFRLLIRWLGLVPRFHNLENRPKNGVAVANHTTPFDVLILNTDTCYSLTGQKHSGIIGFLENTLNRASPHLWFDRGTVADREAVSKRLRKHASNPDNPPVLLFPEGTCINNTAVTQFKKGAFEVGSRVYPVALKYDARFGNAFWNSSKQTALQHVFEMMTSWLILCDIWYLPPMTRQENESSVDFANRVKNVIARKINVIDLTWDGQVKRMKPKVEWKELHRKLFNMKLKSRLRGCKS